MFHSKDFRTVGPTALFNAAKVGGITLAVTTIISDNLNPIIVINSPIPTVIAFFNECGTATTKI